MFIGSINRHMRSVIGASADLWKDLPIYVACSGNFTIERILHKCGLSLLRSNDVSVYSCAVGWHLAGKTVRYSVKDPDWSWLGKGFLEPGLPTIATLLLLSEMLRYKAQNAYAVRMRQEYRHRWPQLHAQTAERVQKALSGIELESFYAGDCRQFLQKADRSGVCLTFPPTYEGGYERMFKRIDEILDWPTPTYEIFSPEDLEAFGRSIREFRYWMSGTDTPQPSLQEFHRATVQTSVSAKPVHIYSNCAPVRLARPRQVIGRNPWLPRTDEIIEPIQIVAIDSAQMNAIRSQYLSHKITPVDAPRNYAVLSAGRLCGAFSFALPKAGGMPGIDMYLLSDFAVRPTPHGRLSKLILACVVSIEVRQDLEQWLCSRIRTLGTTAFTDKPVSMKYRGIFEVHSRSEGKINYTGPLGRWTLKEGFQWWLKNHSTK